MAITIAESANISQNMLYKGIVEELVKVCPIFDKLPFQTIEGNAVAINYEDTADMGSMSWRAPNSVWTESTATFNQKSFSLKILGEDADVDNLIRKTRSNINDQMASQVKIKTKLMGHSFEKAMVYGLSSGTNMPDGLHYFCNATIGNEISAGTSGAGTSGVLTLDMLDRLCDKVARYAGSVDVLFMSRTMHRAINKYLRANGSAQVGRDSYGNPVDIWSGIPIMISDIINDDEGVSSGTPAVYDTETGETSTAACTSIFAVHFGVGDGFVGIENGSIETEVWDKLEMKDASRTRMKWYCGAALYKLNAVACISGLDADGTVVA